MTPLCPTLTTDSLVLGPTRTLLLYGELDLASEHEIDAGITDALAAGASCVAVDLRGLTFMDSSGVRAFVNARHACREQGARFVLIRGSAAVEKVLTLSGLSEFFPTVADPEQLSGDALAA